MPHYMLPLINAYGGEVTPPSFLRIPPFERASAAGVDVVRSVVPNNELHVFPASGYAVPEGGEELARAAAWLMGKMGGKLRLPSLTRRS